MGYYTAYTMDLLDPATQKALPDEKYEAAQTKAVELLREKGVINYALDEDLGCCETAKWYEYDEDILEISKQMPDVLFCVHGEGEETGDIWDHYFLNGKSQRCDVEIRMPPFNPDLLE